MKKKFARKKSLGDEETSCSEYRFDYSKSQPNRFAGKMSKGTVAVVLDPHVAENFRSSESVNSRLRPIFAVSMRTENVTTLKRDTTQILKQLEKNREPILITQNGVPSAYLVDVETFETLQHRMKLLDSIARGENAIKEGRSLTHQQAKQRLSRWLK